ncbi:hypothetical protein [Pseudomonas sp. SDI]|uniref:hypothetical protein n=1 Tax=Pseudomonas sp. SDI TaxID=2170734 RepID=UPI0014031158|nr:hypothetical protein [Pseudomonas sp. SDI]
MLTFDSSRVSKALNSASTTQTKQPSSSPVEDKPAPPAATFPDTRESVSSLAQQLSNAAARAEVENAGLDFAGLAEKAKRINDQLLHSTNKSIQDAELPNTDDPQLLDRARKATDFENGIGRNPFKGLSRDQLSLIVNDESGSFTINERRAARSEAHDQEEAWRLQVIQAAQEEYHNTGKQTVLATECLRHFDSLPVMEQVLYPEDTRAQYQRNIDLDFNYKTGQAEGDAMSLFAKLEEYFDKGSLTGQTNETEATKQPPDNDIVNGPADH